MPDFFHNKGGGWGAHGGGASNWPLRGSKVRTASASRLLPDPPDDRCFPLQVSNWEGGTRGASFVSGGFLPVNVRGTQCHEKVHVADWCKLLMLSRFAALPSR